ncbi:hypothetical protein [Caulobacter hibisci]|uniref:Uncharacterized protein n=1 Tax=Caulobacter hibisci TaxID=2035993 RepID=A0ABS0T5G6_9CAUL|nr:hypothetical protein [Caulobacter hibisci]MBI1686746.1 hypothetical protein [Caulobacter hibisci]
MNRLAFATGVLLLVPAAAFAAPPQPVPSYDAVCLNGEVDKEKLATFYLDLKPVSRTLEDWAQANPDKPFGASRVDMSGWNISPRQRLLVDARICEDNDKTKNPACKADDVKNLAEARAQASLLLQAFGDYFPANFPVSEGGQPVTLLAYFREGGKVLSCPAGAKPPPGSVAPPKFAYTFPMRVRGSTEGLNFDRDEPDFAVFESASVTISNDDVAAKKVRKWSLVAGIPLPTIPVGAKGGGELDIIPYVGGSRDYSHVEGKAPVNTVESTIGGVMADLRIVDPGGLNALATTHSFILRPEYRHSEADKDVSRLWTVTAAWTPIRNNGLNSYKAFSRSRDLVSWRAIFDVRAVGGWFTDRGNLEPPYNQDFLRVGSRAGFAITSDLVNLPVDLVLTDTWLPNLSSGQDINFFTTRLSLSPDPKRIFTLDLSYSKGRRSDVIQDQQEWKLSLGAKY